MGKSINGLSHINSSLVILRRDEFTDDFTLGDLASDIDCSVNVDDSVVIITLMWENTFSFIFFFNVLNLAVEDDQMAPKYG